VANRTVSVIMQAEIGNYVSGMAKAAVATKSVGETAERSAKQSQRGFDLAGRGAALFGIAAAGALVGIITKSMEFDKAMSGVQAATQASTATMGELREAAIKAGADTQYSATEAADAITEMAKAGVSAKDIMGGGLTGALALAAAGQLDVGEAAGIASTAMTQFSLSGEQLPHVADLLAAGAGKAMGSVEDMGAALGQAGLLASSAGISIEETTGALAAFASAGLIGSDAGTSFKSMLQQLQAPSEKSAGLMRELGINAYDAQGNFVGLAGLAGQLQTQLGGLTQAQRDNALAQIFGSDAARAATVLYREGASGIQEWTDKVNDSGYAQRQAAQMTDNLAGDLERLGGSFDTLLISIGQGLQGPLRELVQMLGGLVDGVGGAVKMFGDLPGPVQAAIGAMALWAVAGGKVLGVVGGIRDKFQGFREEMALQQALFAAQNSGLSDTERALGGLGTTAERTGQKFGVARGLISSFAQAIGPELGIAAATYVISSAADSLSRMANAGDDARQEIDDLDDALSSLHGETFVQTLADDIELARTKLAEFRAEANVDGGGFLGALGNPLALGDLTAGFDEATESADEWAKKLADLRREQSQTSETVDELAGFFGITADKVLELAEKYGIDLTNGTTAAMGALAGAKNAEELAADGADGAATSTELFAQQLQATADAADEAKKQTDLFKASLDVLTGAHVSLAQAQADMYAALDSATGAVDDLSGAVLNASGSLNLQSESGRKAQDTLFDIKDAGDQYIATLIEQGGTTEDVIAADHDLRESFIRSAGQMGISREAAEKLADQILGIPSERETTIKADTSDASGDISDFQRQIDNLHGTTVEIQANWANGGSLNGSMRFDFAKGGLLDFYADGGFSENHVAQIAPAGAMRLWAEPETGGEAYIPLAPAKRARSRKIWEETGRRLNAFADGGLINVRADFNPIADFARTAAGEIRKLLEPATGMVGALNWARSQVGKPYIWGSAGPNGYDCSGFQSAITNVILGRSPYSRLGSTATFPWSGFSAGYGQYTIGSTPNAGGGIGHMAGTLLGVNVESNGSDGVVVGSGARGAADSLFSTRAHLAMFNGGVIGEPVFGLGASGRSYSFGERGPEVVLPTSREFGGGSGSSSAAPVVANFDGMQITGTVEFDPSGMLRFVDARISNSHVAANRTLAARGV
jgi:TP901 family phage tail tape measure protein